MSPAGITALVSGLTAFVGAVTALITALRAHGRITTMQQQGSPAVPPSSQAPRP